METIEVDGQVWAVIKENAEPFADSPNDVLRRLLGIDPGGRAKTAHKARERVKRAAPGSILPERDYEGPILRALAERGGRAPAVEVLDAVGRSMDRKLTDRDRERLADGEERWRSRAQFARLAMRKRGLIDGSAPRGVWALTEDGQRAADGL